MKRTTTKKSLKERNQRLRLRKRVAKVSIHMQIDVCLIFFFFGNTIRLICLPFARWQIVLHNGPIAFLQIFVVSMVNSYRAGRNGSSFKVCEVSSLNLESVGINNDCTRSIVLCRIMQHKSCNIKPTRPSFIANFMLISEFFFCFQFAPPSHEWRYIFVCHFFFSVTFHFFFLFFFLHLEPGKHCRQILFRKKTITTQSNTKKKVI